MLIHLANLHFSTCLPILLDYIIIQPSIHPSAICHRLSCTQGHGVLKWRWVLTPDTFIAVTKQRDKQAAACSCIHSLRCDLLRLWVKPQYLNRTHPDTASSRIRSTTFSLRGGFASQRTTTVPLNLMVNFLNVRRPWSNFSLLPFKCPTGGPKGGRRR